MLESLWPKKPATKRTPTAMVCKRCNSTMRLQHETIVAQSFTEVHVRLIWKCDKCTLVKQTEETKTKGEQ
jgi:uncharacterized protein with PIN domain